MARVARRVGAGLAVQMASIAPRAASSSACAWASRGVAGVQFVPLVLAGRETCRLRRSARPGARARAPASPCARAGRFQRVDGGLPLCVQRGNGGGVDAGLARPAAPRTASGRVRLCQACWPWMSTSWSAASRSCAAVAGLPLIHARLLPWVSMVRRSSSVVVGLETRFVQPAGQGDGSIELGADLRAGRAFAHHARCRRGRPAPAAAHRRGWTCRRPFRR